MKKLFLTILVNLLVCSFAIAQEELTPQNNLTAEPISEKVGIEQTVSPVDYTDHIVNPSFEKGTDGWNTNMAVQTNNEPNARKHGNVYCERWTGAPGHLADYFVEQTVTDLPLGKYSLTASCHSENQSGVPALTHGTFLVAGDSCVEVNAPSDYNVYAIVTNGELHIAFRTESTDANWVTVDNFRLAWIGDDIDISIYMQQLEKEIGLLLQLVETKKILTQSQKDEAASVIANARKAATIDEVKAALLSLKECYKALEAFRLDITRNDPYKRYLFTYFPSNSNENLYYAVSEDGFNYTPLNNGRMIMSSDTVAMKKGIRDPHILRGENDGAFYMVATDMRCAEGWDSNRGIVMYRSTDMIHWTHHTVHFPTRFPEKWSKVTRVWAPETIWDPDYENSDGSRGRYMVYFSLLTNDGRCTYDKVFYCYANDDFSDLLTEPVFLYDRGSATIDANIMFDECDGKYHMIYKNEGSGGICHITADRLTAEAGKAPGSQWGKPSGTIQQTNVAVEGGGMFRMINSNTWIVMYDCYGSGYYQFCTTDDWNKYTFKCNTYTSGAFTPRHGTVIPITATEYNALIKAFPASGLKPIEDIPDGIDNAFVAETVASANAKVYNLAGQQVSSSDNSHGIFIMVNDNGTRKIRR